MNALKTRPASPDLPLTDAIEAVCNSIAPTWPLDRMIAVNPHWGSIHLPFDKVARELEQIAGSSLSMPCAYYRDRWQQGAIQHDHLTRAIAEKQSLLSPQQLIDALERESPAPVPSPLLCDSLDGQRDLSHEPAWCDTITQQITQFCAAWFDREQADWHPNQQQDLYASWRQSLSSDHSVALLMKAAHIPAKARDLAATPEAQIHDALQQLGVAPRQWQAYLQAVMMRIGGWAAWCAYRRWQARLQGSDDTTLVDILAIRLSWECLIDDCKRHPGSTWSSWQSDWQQHFQPAADPAHQIRMLWQRAHEISYQDQLLNTLIAAPASTADKTPNVQAVFCIDVRSEVFRRHLEAQSTGIQTLGFAGFFGLPISYTPIGTTATRPQLPGLLAPAIDISDSSGDHERDQQLIKQRETALQKRFNWRPFQSMPASAFTLVETLGLGYAGKLVKRSLASMDSVCNDDGLGLSKSQKAELRPALKAEGAAGLKAQVDLAAQVLGGMNLTENLAKLVLLIGHGSQNQNNPQRAALDCGACCGQTGETNARALAGLLNDPEVRRLLAGKGIAIPEQTRFLAGLHNTTTDEVALFDCAQIQPTHASELAQIKQHLEAAGQATRQERAPSLGLEILVDQPRALTRELKQRANDWAQTRPEWGLANNATFIVAPRAKTRGINLGGRSFLHDYDYHKDPDGAILELIMTAPMVVTHWINMQYHASTVDNKRYGSGNKTLHNVVGGRLGVFEGNGGDLRTGLAMQSVHDGDNWQHEPLRLTVVIDAPLDAIEGVIKKHAVVKSLVENQWLHLARMDEASLSFYRDGKWQRHSLNR